MAKDCLFEGCPRKRWGGGYCNYHQYMRPPKNSIKNDRGLFQRGKEVESEESKLEKAEMDLFWKVAEKKIAENPFCMECGAFIPAEFYKKIENEDKYTYRNSTAHVLPKRKEYGFPSIASNLHNMLILGVRCGCHARYDNSWEDAAKMKVFRIAIEKFLLLYPHIAKTEIKNIPEVLLQEMPPG